MVQLFQNVVYSEKEEFASPIANSFLQNFYHIEWSSKKENGRIAYPENVPIHILQTYKILILVQSDLGLKYLKRYSVPIFRVYSEL